MAQYLCFASIPNTQPQAYYATIVPVLAEIKRSSPTDKELRQFLKQRNLYDKGSFERVLEILDIKSVGGRFVLGEWAQKMLDAKDEQEFKEVLARRLYELNPLMMKYCLVAMDTEHEGRLHSTNELFRMLTSFVYPGKKPILVDFKAYVDWGVSAGLWRMVGVRWGLGDVGKKMLEVVRRLDDDEFLEEEREALEGREEEERIEQEEIEESKGVEAQVQEAAEERVEEASAVKAPEVQEPVEVKIEPRVAEPKVAPRPVQIDEAFRQESSEYLKRWFEKYTLGEVLKAQGLGLRKESPTLLVESAFCALLLSRGLRGKEVLWAMDFLSQFKVFGCSSFGEIPFERIAGALKQKGGSFAWFEALVYVPMLAGKMPQVLPKALEAHDFKEFLSIVWSDLFEPYAPLAPFYFARLLLDLGILPERLSRAGFVPSLLVRENAFRIGLIDGIVASDFQELVRQCETLSSLFPKPYFETPLAMVKSAFGCLFDCPRKRVCECPCLEKTEVTGL